MAGMVGTLRRTAHFVALGVLCAAFGGVIAVQPAAAAAGCALKPQTPKLRPSGEISFEARFRCVAGVSRSVDWKFIAVLANGKQITVTGGGASGKMRPAKSDGGERLGPTPCAGLMRR